MTKAQIDQNMDGGMKELSGIFQKEKHSDFESIFVNFVNIYSRAAFTPAYSSHHVLRKHLDKL